MAVLSVKQQVKWPVLANIKIHQIIRSRRKSIGLMINQEAQLIVRAPHFVSQDYIQKLVSQKQDWIVRKQQQFQGKQARVLKRNYVPGEEFWYLGNSYKLEAVDDLPKAIIFDGSLKISSMVLANAKQHLENWYKAQAWDYISQKVSDLALIDGLKYASIKVNDAKTRWGSCGYKDTLNFTWRLIMAPQRVVDYVIVHELMHLKQRNHSHKFWAEVAQLTSDYKQDELWLKKNGHLLAWKA